MGAALLLIYCAPKSSSPHPLFTFPQSHRTFLYCKSESTAFRPPFLMIPAVNDNSQSMLSWGDYGPCRVPDCTDSCGFFCVAGGNPADPDSALALASTASSASHSGPTAQSAKSAQASTGFSSFVDATKARDARRTETLQGNLNFDAATKAQQAFFAKAGEPGKRGKQRTASGSAKPEKAKQPATPKFSSFTIILADNTKAANSTGFKEPNENICVETLFAVPPSHEHSGCVFCKPVPNTATPSDITSIVTTAFGNVPLISQGRASMYGSSLCIKFSVGKGAPGIWRVNKALGEFTLQDLECNALLMIPRHFPSLPAPIKYLGIAATLPRPPSPDAGED
ncbi:hypothetical protein C8F01DRAFT_1232298 [Mycena amicta]|nr:hypothetical protein C8F01DRAFT_1232298 [Mycena amicta]